jgi:hypothetical protein
MQAAEVAVNTQAAAHMDVQQLPGSWPGGARGDLRERPHRNRERPHRNEWHRRNGPVRLPVRLELQADRSRGADLAGYSRERWLEDQRRVVFGQRRRPLNKSHTPFLSRRPKELDRGWGGVTESDVAVRISATQDAAPRAVSQVTGAPLSDGRPTISKSSSQFATASRTALWLGCVFQTFGVQLTACHPCSWRARRADARTL